MLRQCLRILTPVGFSVVLICLSHSVQTSPPVNDFQLTPTAPQLDSFQLPQGDWVPADSSWAFRSTGLVRLEDFNPPIPSAADIQTVTELDEHVMCLVESSMQPSPGEDGTTRWTTDRKDFYGEAISISMGESEVPLIAWLATPFEDEWTVLVGRRVGEVDEPLVKVPDAWTLEATRLTPDKSPSAQLFRTTGSIEAMEAWLRQQDATIFSSLPLDGRHVIEFRQDRRHYTLTFLSSGPGPETALLQDITPHTGVSS